VVGKTNDTTKNLQILVRLWKNNRTKCVPVGPVTIADDKILIEIFEKNWGQRSNIGRKSDLIKARLINDNIKILVIH
jgi:hypothetical protein